MSQSTGRRRLWWFKLLKLWPHHSSLDKTLQGNSAFGILKIASTMVGTGLTPSGLSRNPVKNNTCCIRSRKLWRFSSLSLSASSCVIPHPYLRTRSAMFCYRKSSFLPGLPAVSFDISRSRWRIAKADVSASTCQKEYGRLWRSLISDLKYVGEARYRTCKMSSKRGIYLFGVRFHAFCEQIAKVRTLGQLPTTRVRTSAFCCR